mgnify:CR=1 FL=1
MPDPVTRRELIRRFKQLGFTGPVEGAKHAFMVKSDLKVRIPNPDRGEIDGALLREILRQAGVAWTTWKSVH